MRLPTPPSAIIAGKKLLLGKLWSATSQAVMFLTYLQHNSKIILRLTAAIFCIIKKSPNETSG